MKLFLILILASLAIACSDDETVDTVQGEAPDLPSILDTQMDALEKAQSVEQSLQEMTKERAEEMRQQGI